jgi:hypothetical protein
LLALLEDVFPTQFPFFLSANTLSPFELFALLELFLAMLDVLPLEAEATGLLLFTNRSLKFEEFLPDSLGP